MNDQTAKTIAADIASQMQAGWNAGDGEAYTTPMAEDSDYVTINGLVVAGRKDQAEGIGQLYDTIYKGSSIEIDVVGARMVDTSTVVAHLRHVLECPIGPLAGSTETLATIVAVDGDDGWQVESLHNTIVAPPPGP